MFRKNRKNITLYMPVFQIENLKLTRMKIDKELLRNIIRGRKMRRETVEGTLIWHVFQGNEIPENQKQENKHTTRQ